MTRGLGIKIRETICDQRFNSPDRLYNQVLRTNVNYTTPVLQVLIARKKSD